VFNYVKTVSGVTFNGAARKGSGTSNSDGSSSGAGQNAWDFALTTNGDMVGVDGLAMGAGYGEAEEGESGEDKHSTIFANYSFGMVTAGYQVSAINKNGATGVDEDTNAWGLAFNINENLSVSYGEREVEYNNPTSANITESGDGVAVAYTMGSIKVAGNHNEVSNNDNAEGVAASDSMTEIAVSFAF